MTSIMEMVRDDPVGMNCTHACPKCLEKSLSTLRRPDGMVLYQCWRATCAISGVKGGGARGPGPKAPAFEPNPYPYPTAAVKGAYYRVRDDGEGRGVWSETVWECIAFDGALLGNVSRRVYENPAQKKLVRTWRELNRPFYCVPRPLSCSRRGVWLVEDTASAVRLGENHCAAVSLLGTTPSEDFLRDELDFAMRRYEKTRIVIALDPGAEAAAARLRDRLRARADYEVLVIPIEMDIKDMTESRLEALVDFYNPC